jgi:hypothetical protein
LLAALLVAPAARLAGAESRFLYPEPGATLDAERSVRIAWSLDTSAPLGSEMELVLSLDGGRTFPVRITGDLDPQTRDLLLTVPALPAASARFALRAGDRGEPGDEEILLVSEGFSIAADPQQPLEPALFVRGEWRTRETLSGREVPAPPDPGAFGAGSSTVHAASTPVPAGPPRPRPLSDSLPVQVHSSLESAPMTPSGATATLLSRAPSDAPRRE